MPEDYSTYMGWNAPSSASPAAQAYFNGFSPEQQAQIRASWGGQDLMEQWFQNAVAAGATDQTGTRQPGQGQGQVVDPGSQAPAGSVQNPNPQWLRWYAASQGWGEDFQRFDDNTLQQWINNYWDPSTGHFRPETGGDYNMLEKPSECPPGTTMHGSNCVSWDALPSWAGGPGGAGAGAAGTTTPGQAPATNALAAGLNQAFTDRQGIFGNTNPLAATSRTLGNPYMLGGQMLEGGGMWWGQPGYNEGGKPPAALTPETLGSQAFDVAKTQAAKVGATPTASTWTPAAWGLETGAGAASPLAEAVSEQFKKRQQTPQWWEGVA